MIKTAMEKYLNYCQYFKLCYSNLINLGAKNWPTPHTGMLKRSLTSDLDISKLIPKAISTPFKKRILGLKKHATSTLTILFSAAILQVTNVTR